MHSLVDRDTIEKQGRYITKLEAERVAMRDTLIEVRGRLNSPIWLYMDMKGTVEYHQALLRMIDKAVKT